MTWEQVWLIATSVIALVALLAAAMSWRRAGQAEAEVLALRQFTDLVQPPVSSVSRTVADDPNVATFVITHLDEEEPSSPPLTPQRIEGRLFADIVARESVVKAASWTYGVRRALSAQSRNRIRFHMRQETKRAGRDRKAEMKTALREYRARARADEEDVA